MTDRATFHGADVVPPSFPFLPSFLLSIVPPRPLFAPSAPLLYGTGLRTARPTGPDIAGQERGVLRREARPQTGTSELRCLHSRESCPHTLCVKQRSFCTKNQNPLLRRQRMWFEEESMSASIVRIGLQGAVEIRFSCRVDRKIISFQFHR